MVLKDTWMFLVASGGSKRCRGCSGGPSGIHKRSIRFQELSGAFPWMSGTFQGDSERFQVFGGVTEEFQGASGIFKRFPKPPGTT